MGIAAKTASIIDATLHFGGVTNPLPTYHDPRELPSHLKTKRMHLKNLMRLNPGAEARGVLTILHDNPVGASFRHDPLGEDWLHDLRGGLRLIGGLGEVESDLRGDLFRRGQLTESNLYHVNDATPITTFTSEAEAEDYLSLLLFDGSHAEHYIVKDPETGDKATWKKRISRPDLGPHLRGERLCGPKRGTQISFVAPDGDRHSGAISAAEHQRRGEVISRVLLDKFADIIWRPEINPKNGSFKFFGWLGRWVPRDEARLFCMEIREALTDASPEDAHLWARIELYPDNSPQVYAPLHPQKITITDKGRLDKVKRYRYIKDANGKKRRRYYRAYSCLDYVNGIIAKKQFDLAAFAAALAEACKNCPDLTPEEVLELHAAKTAGKSKKADQAKKSTSAKKKQRAGVKGSLGSLKGRFISVLIEFFHDEEMPEDGTLNTIMGCYLRLACYQKVELEDAVGFFIDHLKHRKHVHFSGRLSEGNYESIDKALRATAKAVWDGNRYQADPTLSHKKLTEVVDYCQSIGFLITRPETWSNYKSQGRGSCGPKMVWDEKLNGLALEFAQITHADLTTTKRVMENIISFVHVKGELALSMVARLVEPFGVKCGSHAKRTAIRAFLVRNELIILHTRHFYDVTSGYRHGCFYYAGATVQFESDTEAAGPSTHTHPHTPLSIVSALDENHEALDESAMADQILRELILSRKRACLRLYWERRAKLEGHLRQAA